MTLPLAKISDIEKSDVDVPNKPSPLEETLGHSVTALTRKPEDLARLQDAQLSRIYSYNDPTSLLDFIHKTLASTFTPNPFESSLLQALYQDRKGYYELAHRDLDGDGVRDFAVDEYLGKIFELDLDVDGDGIDNYFDSEPFDPKRGGKDLNGDGLPDASFTDTNHNSIPDHVDFAITAHDPQVVAIQKRIFDRFKILLVERDIPFTLSTAMAIEYVLTRVYDKLIAALPDGPRSLLRVIASEKDVLLDYDATNETFAITDQFTRCMVIYERAVNSSGPIQVAVIIHETAHAFQSMQDTYVKKIGLPTPPQYGPQFAKSMTPLGWRLEDTTEPPIPFQSFHGYWDEGLRVTAYYKGVTTDDWSDLLTKKKDKFNESPIQDGHYLDDPELSRKHIVNDYALTNILEFHSEIATAAFWLAVEDQLAIRLQNSEVNRLSADLAQKRANNVMTAFLDADPSYKGTRFSKARGSDYLPVLSSWLTLSASSLDAFIDMYGLDR